MNNVSTVDKLRFFLRYLKEIQKYLPPPPKTRKYFEKHRLIELLCASKPVNDVRELKTPVFALRDNQVQPYEPSAF